MLGKGRSALFRRAELKTLVSLYGNEVCIRQNPAKPIEGLVYSFLIPSAPNM